ncbi:MAG TPA: XrtA/PEP-CTERM system TPR-repeat protein PrsT [Rhizomicrobium sp.]|jgi:putative PEP-CTERM system TPR-repeat lipoprotein|nr:XrtA/PEP-CTERM system TPR-repeat protein PrsT [Rhizomicrobium sp.]
MPQISTLSNSVILLALLGVAPGAFAPAALADNPPHKGAAPHVDPQVKQFTAAAVQAIRQGNLSLATIQLKNALRLNPDNGTLRVQLGFVELEGGDPVSAEREIRQGRLNGAKDQDAVPPLLQAMLARQEYSDLLFQFPDPAATDKSKLAVATLRSRAEALQATGDPAGAVTAMNRALAIQRDAGGLLERGRIAILQNQPGPAMGYINQTLALSPNNPAAMMLKASIVRAHDKKAALAMVDSVLKAHPESMSATITRIEMLLDMNQVETAQQATDALLAQKPNLPVALFYKAIILGIHNKPLDGWRIAQSLPSDFIQSNPRIAIGVAQLADASGNSESANSILTAFVGQHPKDAQARARLAALRLKMNNPTYALEILQPVINSQDPQVLQLIAATYRQLKQGDKMLEYMRKAEAAGSTNPTLKYDLAVADLDQNNTAQGMQEMLDLMKHGQINAAMGATAVLLRQRKFAEAQSLADQAEKLNPKSPVPPLLKGQILYAQGKLDASLPLLNQSLQRNPRFEPALYDRAQILSRKGKFPEAERDLKQAQAVQPKNPLSYVQLAEIAAIQKQPAQAISLLKQGIGVAPKTIGTRLVLAKYQVNQKKFADAQATLKAALQIAPNDPQCLALLGQVQQAMGQKAAAVGTEKLLTQKYQKSGAAQALLANSLLSNGDKKGAIAALKQATQLSPSVQQYYMLLIDLQMQTGDKDGAVATARSWTTSQKDPNAAILLAQTLANVGRLPEAAAVIAKAQAVRPDWQLTIVQSAIAKQRGEQARALSVLKDWLAGNSTDLPVRQAYGDMLLAAGQDSSALAQYELVLKARGDNPDALNNIAWLLRDSNPARALTLASKAVQLEPTSADMNDTLGYLLLQKKDPKSALPMLQRAHLLGPANGQISYHLALAYKSLGRKAEAKQTLQDALAKDKNFSGADDAKKLLQQL